MLYHDNAKAFLRWIDAHNALDPHHYPDLVIGGSFAARMLVL
jgi:hypothetical protein